MACAAWSRVADAMAQRTAEHERAEPVVARQIQWRSVLLGWNCKPYFYAWATKVLESVALGFAQVFVRGPRLGDPSGTITTWCRSFAIRRVSETGRVCYAVQRYLRSCVQRQGVLLQSTGDSNSERARAARCLRDGQAAYRDAQSRAGAGRVPVTGKAGEQTGTGEQPQTGTDTGVGADSKQAQPGTGDLEGEDELDGFEEALSVSDPDDNTFAEAELVVAVADLADMGTSQSSGQGVEQAAPPPAATATAQPNPGGEAEGPAAAGMADHEDAAAEDENADSMAVGEDASQARFTGRTWAEVKGLCVMYGKFLKSCLESKQPRQRHRLFPAVPTTVGRSPFELDPSQMFDNVLLNPRTSVTRSTGSC